MTIVWLINDKKRTITIQNINDKIKKNSAPITEIALSEKPFENSWCCVAKGVSSLAHVAPDYSP